MIIVVVFSPYVVLCGMLLKRVCICYIRTKMSSNTTNVTITFFLLELKARAEARADELTAALQQRQAAWAALRKVRPWLNN